jgi:hypothetical protein
MLTQPQHNGPSVTHPANHLKNVLKINKMVRVSPNNGNKGAAMGSVQFVQRTNRAKTSAAVWHLAKPRVLENIHKRKINKEIQKNLILLLTDILRIYSLYFDSFRLESLQSAVGVSNFRCHGTGQGKFGASIGCLNWALKFGAEIGCLNDPPRHQHA